MSEDPPVTRREAVDLAKYALKEAENYQPRYDICTFYATMSIAYSTLAAVLPELRPPPAHVPRPLYVYETKE